MSTTVSVSSIRKLASNAITSALYFGPTSSATGVVTVTTNAVLKSLSAVTIEAWVNMAIMPAGYNARIVSYTDASSKGYELFVVSNTQTLEGAIGNSTTVATTSGGAAVPLGTWCHVATTWDGSSVRTFINGVKATDAALSGGNTGDPAKNLTIGNFSSGARAFPGLISEVRISNNARYTAAFTPPTAAFTNDANTIGLWHIDDGSGTSVVDSGVNALTGTASGTPTPLWSRGYFQKAGTTARHLATTRLLAPTTATTSLYLNGDYGGFYITPITVTPILIGLTTDFSFGVKALLRKKTLLGNLDDHALLSSDFNFGSNKGYTFQVNPADGGFTVFAGSTSYTSSTGVVPYDQFTYIIFTLTGTTMKAYVDGTLVWTQTITRKDNAGGGTTHFLTEGGGEGAVRDVYGYVRDIFSTQTLLAQAAVTNIVSSGIYPAVDLHYLCNEGAGAATADQSGNGNHGIIQNGNVFATDWRRTGRTVI